MRANASCTATLLVAAAALLAGCDTDNQVTGERADAKTRPKGVVAYGSGLAECDEAIPDSVRTGGANPTRGFSSAGPFGLLQSQDAFERAQPAGMALAPAFGDLAITKTPATVLGDDSVTVTIPAGSRDEAGLVFGSLRGYDHPLAQVTFEPCTEGRGTSWPGGLALKTREPVTLLITSEAGDQVWRLRAGDPGLIALPIAVGEHVARCSSAMLGNMRISDSALRRDYNVAGRFALLQSPAALRHAHTAGGQLAPRFKDVLLTKIPATVLGTEPVTLEVPRALRDEVGLLYGSLSGYEVPFAEVTFMPCPGRAGTSWPGGLAMRSQPVTLLVSTADGERSWELTVGA